MKLSTKGRYGLRALADLAIHAGEGPVSVASIAQRQNISDNYLESMFATLKHANIVRSVKGAGGGYMLVNVPADINIGEVLRVLEGDLSIVDSTLTDEDIRQKSLRFFLETSVWDEVTTKINDVVDNLTLKDLMERPQ